MNPVKLQDVPTQVFRLKAEVFGTQNPELRVSLGPPALPVPPFSHVSRFTRQAPARSLADIAVRNEAKEVRPDARPSRDLTC